MATSPSPFAFRDFRFYLLSRFSTMLAQNSMVVVIGWQVYDIARDPLKGAMDVRDAAFQLGLVGLIQFVPLAALTLITGWTADRIDRRIIVRLTVSLEALCAAILAWHSWHDTATLPWMFFVAALLGVARAFAGPAYSALAPNLVPLPVLPQAIAVSSVAWQTGAIIGPAMGGYLYAIDHWVPYTVSMVLCLSSVLMLSMIGPVPRAVLDRTVHPVKQMIEGLHYVRRNRLVLGAISLDLFAVLFGGATAMLPIYARDVLHVGAEGLGHLRGAPAIGSALIAIWFSFRPLKNDVGVKMLAAVCVFGLSTVIFGLSTWLPLSLGALALLGAADMVSVYVRQSLIQLHTPDSMRGRVGAVSGLFISGSNELGEAESGAMAALLGPVAAVVAGGVAAIGVTLLWSRIFPELRRARTFDPPEVPETMEEVPGQEIRT
ncbi:MFS transporter [Sphingomonas naphthae]|uniref:MFS transporter n=1 Tax=Sphingomonas naphthae TaxID=1813468 RepID=A0ABY7TNP2_9SPHN|nr:MFS transporter [Sphingomonas naphthae]WCT74601.1 MFS transporter [Sphingomonas naphthae]